MKDIERSIKEALRQKLEAQGFNGESIEMRPLPARGDRMLKLRSLEEALDELENNPSTGAFGFIVQIKPVATSPMAANETTFTSSTTPSLVPSSTVDAVWMGDSHQLNPEELLRSAEILMSSGDHGLARNIFRAVFKSGQKTPETLLGIARTYEGELKWDEAEKYYRDSIAYEPNLDAFQKLAALQIRKKNDDAAAATLERALQLRDLSDVLRFELLKAAGNCWLRAGRNEAAEACFKKSLALDPTSDAALANLGAALLQSGKTTEAKRCLQDAISVNPRNAKALSGLGTVYLTEGDKRSAHDHFARSLEVEINNPSALFYLVRCAFEVRTYATAARLVEGFMQVAPVSASLLYSLATLQFHLGRISEAKDTCEKILLLQPEHKNTRELLQMISRYLAQSSQDLRTLKGEA